MDCHADFQSARNDNKRAFVGCVIKRGFYFLGRFLCHCERCFCTAWQTSEAKFL
ncbi:hypothetical protein [Helicobacter canis]|uniref:hypothetical protein n=1 Tax=Helicobacter canis TaxID=29419 RepID=UPI0015F00077|nr:hypothetical protein [Helicobacter canis]